MTALRVAPQRLAAHGAQIPGRGPPCLLATPPRVFGSDMMTEIFEVLHAGRR